MSKLAEQRHLMKSVESRLLDLGALATPEDLHQFRVHTVVGDLSLSLSPDPPDAGQPVKITIFGRFAETKRALEKVCCNRSSGKYNWHGCDPVEVEVFFKWLRKLLPASKVNHTSHIAELQD